MTDIISYTTIIQRLLKVRSTLAMSNCSENTLSMLDRTIAEIEKLQREDQGKRKLDA